MRRSAVLSLLAICAAAAVPAVASAAAPATTVDPETHVFWYLARASGFGAYCLLFCTMVLGLAMRLGKLDALMARWQSFDLHQFTALLGLGLLALHLGSLLADHFIGFTLGQLMVPFASPYRPLWTGLGVIALYLLLALTVSFSLRPLIGRRTWRTIHYASFGAYLLALAHGLFTGTDSGEWWARLLYWGTGAIVGLLVVLRLNHAEASPRERRARQAPIPWPVPASRPTRGEPAADLE